MDTADSKGDWGPGIIGVTTVLEIFVLIAIVLRVCTRVWIVKSFWWDDFTIILAVVRPQNLSLPSSGTTADLLSIAQLGTTIGAALCFVEVHYGFGRHISFLSTHQIREFEKFTFGEWIQTFQTLMFTKVSICLFLMRIPNSRRLIVLMQWAVAFLLFSNTILTVIWIMQCQPVHVAWYGEGTCMAQGSKEAVILTQAIISIISDFAFATFPILILWKLQIDLKTKIGLWLLMCLGFITGACCIVRTVLNNQSLPTDGSYDGIINWIWRTFEVQIGIIAACIPTLRPLYAVLAKKLPTLKGPSSSSAAAPTNVKWIGSEKGHQSLIENISHHSSPRRDLQPQAGQSFQQDLVGEGILKSKAHGLPNARPLDLEKAEDWGLSDDMQRYGIQR